MSDVSTPSFPNACVWWVPAPYRRPSPALTFCCVAMTKAVAHFCDEHESPWDCNYATLVYNEALDEYGVLVRDRDAEYVLINHCPWCATKRPPSRRDDWFDTLEAKGFDNLLGIEASDLPEEFLTAAWRTPPTSG